MLQYKSLPLNRSFEINSVVCIQELQFAPGYFFAGEYHDFWEIALVRSGYMNTTSDSYVYNIFENQAVFHLPMTFHRSLFPTNSATTALFISFQTDYDFSSLVKNKIFDVDNTLLTLFDLLQAEALQFINHYNEQTGIYEADINPHADFASSHRLKNILELIVIQFIRLSMDKNNKHIDYTMFSTSTSDLFSRIVEFMKQNIQNALNISDICTHCHCSRSNAKKVIHKHTGMGMMQLFNQLKIKYSLSLLQENKKVAEIAQTLSFSSYQYYSLIFKKIMGMTISNYRKKVQKKQCPQENIGMK